MPSDELSGLLERFQGQRGEVRDRAGWEELRLEWLGRKRGTLRDLQSRLKEIDPAERRDYGRALNELRGAVEGGLEELDRELGERERAAARQEAKVDVTLPGRGRDAGSLHPITRVFYEIASIFSQMGYAVSEGGREAESDYYNFEALNFPADHPARDEQDTFFLEDGRVLRTHTSPVQIRTMQNQKPPLRVLHFGRCYRVDNDLRHSPMFHQIEVFAVDEGITFGDLKGTLEAFLTRLFTAQTKVRLRPSFFPFTEPSAEVDITCPFCSPDDGSQEKCGTCSATGWMEILGSGMIDPRVLENCGLDPKKYSGFAFGTGIDRMAMARYGLPNIRTLFENDERVLRQVVV